MPEEKKKDIENFLLGSIDKKMGLAFGSLAILVLLIGVLALYQFSKISEPLIVDLPRDINSLSLNSHLDSDAQFIRYYDEVLTMSARNYAFTGDKKWKDRYNNAAPELDKMIKDAMAQGDDIDRGYFSKIDAANLALVDLETQAMNAVDDGNKEEAVRILESTEYWQQKDIYSQGLKNYLARRGAKYNESLSVSTKTTDAAIKKTQEMIQQSSQVIIAIIVLAIIATAIILVLVSRYISKPIHEIHKATEELEKGNFSTRVDIQTGDELEQLGKTFNRTIEQLGKIDDERKQVDKAKTEFISITSHELRSPMTPMKAQLQMLAQGYFGKLNKKQSEAVDIVVRNTERLDHIILDFLEISRIEAARLKFNFVKANLEEHINRLVEEMNSYLPEKKITIEKRIEKLPEFEVDPDRVMQVLRNLVNNAKKFSPEKGKITIEAKKEENGLLFSVQDQGIGIAKENQVRIFEPFFQEEQTMYRQYGGTGLGLAICKGIVESQNGKIWFESDRGKGTRFYFTVPFEPVREIEPIRVLFSQQSDSEKKMKKLFTELLGPLGEKEFEEIMRKGKINNETITKYFTELKNNGIITKENLEKFKLNNPLSNSETRQ